MEEGGGWRERRRENHWSVKEGWRNGVKVAVEAGFNQRALMGSEAVCVCVWTGRRSHCAQLCVSCI